MCDLNIDDGGGESFSSGYDANTLTLYGSTSKVEVPNTVGCWRMNGNFHVYVTEKPNWFHRKMTKLLLGWVWIDT
jgi:hypothetical protein